MCCTMIPTVLMHVKLTLTCVQAGPSVGENPMLLKELHQIFNCGVFQNYFLVSASEIRSASEARISLAEAIVATG